MSISSDEILIAKAKAVRDHAYAPYSGYLVGAALRATDGDIFTGANVENLSFGLTICAERSAVAAMVSAGKTRWTELAVATKDGGTPCGMCLQTLVEFVEDPANCRILLCGSSGTVTEHRLIELLPMGFASDAVRRVG